MAQVIIEGPHGAVILSIPGVGQQLLDGLAGDSVRQIKFTQGILQKGIGHFGILGKGNRRIRQNAAGHKLAVYNVQHIRGFAGNVPRQSLPGLQIKPLPLCVGIRCGDGADGVKILLVVKHIDPFVAVIGDFTRCAACQRKSQQLACNNIQCILCCKRKRRKYRIGVIKQGGLSRGEIRFIHICTSGFLRGGTVKNGLVQRVGENGEVNGAAQLHHRFRCRRRFWCGGGSLRGRGCGCGIRRRRTGGQRQRRGEDKGNALFRFHGYTSFPVIEKLCGSGHGPPCRSL